MRKKPPGGASASVGFRRCVLATVCFLHVSRPQSPEASFQRGGGITVGFRGADRLVRLGKKKKQTTEGRKRPEISLSGANEAARGEKRRLSALTLRARGSGATNPGKVGGAESGVCRRRDRRSLCLLSPAPGGGKINRRMNIYGVCLAEYRFAVRRSLVITQRRLSCAPRVHITHIVGGLLMPLRPPGGTDDAAVINLMYRSRSKRRECLRHK